MNLLQNDTKRKKMVDGLTFALLALFGLIFLVPFLWMIVVSFERYSNLNPPFPPTLLISEFSFFNFNLVTETGALYNAYLNSFIVAVCSVAVNLLAVITGGYAFSKFNFKGKKIVFAIIMATMMVPFETRMLPMFRMFNELNLLNTYTPLILPHLIDGFGLMLAKQFFDKLPDSLGEAADIDGAGPFKKFFAIFMPLTTPIMATIIILKFMASWNDFLWPHIVLTGEKYRTIPIFIASFSAENGARLVGSTMSVAFAGVIPVLIVFLFLQKYIIQSIALSGVKGE